MGANTPLLLVVSHPRLREVVVRVLLRDGFIVLEADEGAEALAVVETHVGAVSLVIADDELPDMNGAELAAQVKQRFSGVPVLLFHNADFHRETAPADGFLCKPFGPAMLIEAVRLLLGGPLQ